MKSAVCVSLCDLHSCRLTCVLRNYHSLGTATSVNQLQSTMCAMQLHDGTSITWSCIACTNSKCYAKANARALLFALCLLLAAHQSERQSSPLLVHCVHFVIVQQHRHYALRTNGTHSPMDSACVYVALVYCCCTGGCLLR
jgi:hypothetical protein